MAERSVLQSLSGATLAISATLPATYDAAGYGATSVSYTAIGSVESFGNYGVRASQSTFTAIADAVLQKFKGTKDYGNANFVLGYMPSDAGQDIVETAVESQNRYSVKITYPLGAGESTNEIHYLDVLVMAREFQNGATDAVRKLSLDLAVCRKPVIVAAT